MNSTLYLSECTLAYFKPDLKLRKLEWLLIRLIPPLKDNIAEYFVIVLLNFLLPYFVVTCGYLFDFNWLLDTNLLFRTRSCCNWLLAIHNFDLIRFSCRDQWNFLGFNAPILNHRLRQLRLLVEAVFFVLRRYAWRNLGQLTLDRFRRSLVQGRNTRPNTILNLNSNVSTIKLFLLARLMIACL